jgi:probable rRNA maturation factor
MARGGGLSVAICDARGRPRRQAGLASWLRGIAPRRFAGHLTVAFVSDPVSRRLNRAYRGVDRPTDVLSFPTDSGWHDGRWRPEAPGSRRPALLGDVVIATGVARRQARRLGHGFDTEVKWLVLHGLLHLVGYDHERDEGRMAAAERALARRGGLGGGLLARSVR